jgi:hypothetical protein
VAFIILLLLTAIALAIYVVWVRPWLRQQPWAAGYFRLIEPVEILFWNKSESILWARFLQIAGVLTTVLQFLGTIDVTPFISFIPEGYRPALFLLITLSGFINEWLRKDTTKPLEIVALPENVPPEVEQAIARAEVANVVAVKAAEQGAV